MKWTLKKVEQITSNPYLNFFVLTYDISDENKTISDYHYYMVSRRKKEDLICLTKKYSSIDGVIIPLYYIDPLTGEISILITSQFRPTINRYVNSFIAGLVDKEDKDLITSIKREAKEEAGVELADIEILTSPGTTSVGLSDEINIIALGRIVAFKETNLEECEDISFKMVPLKELKEQLKTDSDKYYFPINIKIILLYLLERFKANI